MNLVKARVFFETFRSNSGRYECRRRPFGFVPIKRAADHLLTSEAWKEVYFKQKNKLKCDWRKIHE